MACCTPSAPATPTRKLGTRSPPPSLRVLGSEHGCMRRSAPGAERLACAASSDTLHGVVGELGQVVDHGVDVAAEGVVQERRRRQQQPNTFRPVLAEVDRWALDVDVAASLATEIELLYRHVARMGHEPGSDGIHALVRQMACLRLCVEQPHRVRGAVVEELARRVVALLAVQRVERAVQVSVEAPFELGQVGVAGSDIGVVVADVEDRVVHGNAGCMLGPGERVQPALLDDGGFTAQGAPCGASSGG
jgi:hypothetical protein